MKIAEKIQSYGETLGVKRRNDGTGLLNRRNVIVTTIYVLFFLQSTAYLVYKAKTLKEYAMCFFVWYAICIYKKKKKNCLGF